MLANGFIRVVERARADYVASLQAVDQALLKFVAEQTTHLKEPAVANGQRADSRRVVQLDWAAQRAKARHVPAAHEKAPLRSVRHTAPPPPATFRPQLCAATLMNTCCT